MALSSEKDLRGMLKLLRKSRRDLVQFEPWEASLGHESFNPDPAKIERVSGGVQ